MKWLFCRTGVNPAPSSLRELGDQVRVLCEEAQVDSADPITLDATEVLLEREREKCFHEEQAMQEMEAQQTELARIRTKAQELAVESHDREQEAQQYRTPLACPYADLAPATVPSPERRHHVFRKGAETARNGPIWPLPMPIMNNSGLGRYAQPGKTESLPYPGIARLLRDSSEPH